MAHSFEPGSDLQARDTALGLSHWCSSHRMSSFYSDMSSDGSRRRSDSLCDAQEPFKVTLTEEAFAKQEVKPVLKSSRSQSLLSQLLDDESSCIQSMSSSFRFSHAVRIFDLFQHMPNVDLNKLLVRDLVIAVASLYEIQVDESLALHVADELGFPEDDFPALTGTACVGTVGESSFVLMQGDQRIAHVQIRSRKVAPARKPGESWKYDGDHYISPVRELSYRDRNISCSIGSDGWYSYKSHQQLLSEAQLSQSPKQQYAVDGKQLEDTTMMRQWEQQQAEDARTESCTEDEHDDVDITSGGNGDSDDEIFDFDDA